MATNIKKITFDFYQCEALSSQSSLPPISVGEIFSRFNRKLDAVDQNTVRNFKGKTYELKWLQPTDYGYRGIIGKYRKALLPNAGVPGGEERELDLEEDEHLIEKCFFKFYHDYSLIILQRNFFAVNYSAFSNYLSIDGYAVSLNPVIEAADLQRLMNNEFNIRSITAAIARPTNPQLFRECEHDFSNSILASLNGSNAALLNVTLRGDGHSKDPEKRYLDSKMKRAILELKGKAHLKKANLELEDRGGVTHPVDLVTDRLTYTKPIEVVGRYPLPSDMWEAINEARLEKETELDNYFGALN